MHAEALCDEVNKLSFWQPFKLCSTVIMPASFLHELDLQFPWVSDNKVKFGNPTNCTVFLPVQWVRNPFVKERPVGNKLSR